MREGGREGGSERRGREREREREHPSINSDCLELSSCSCDPEVSLTEYII